MTGSLKQILGGFLAVVAFAGSSVAPLSAARANDRDDFEEAFDAMLGTKPRVPQAVPQALPQPHQSRARLLYQFQQVPRSYASPFEARIAAVAGPEQGRIGVAAVDLTSGRTIQILGDQPFPMASTSKIAIVATFLAGV